MDSFRITRLEEPSPDHRRAILAGLDAFSDPRAGAGDWPEHDLCLAIRGADGGIAGGLWGRFYYDWLFIELIFVPETRRGENLGSALLAAAEAQARAWGGVGVWLDTFTFQARGFYEKKGYALFGTIDDYPTPHQRFFLSKRLDPAGPRAVLHPAIEPIASPPAEARQAIDTPLSAFNDSRIGGGPWPDADLALVIADEAGVRHGGLCARSYYNWMHVDLLFVPESLRGRGLGSTLLQRAEAEAWAQGCIGVWLDTFTFQAPGFYPRHGYEAFGAIEAYPGSHSRHFFRKRL